MTTVYGSIEAAEVACVRPAQCGNCQHQELTRHTYGIGSVLEDKPVKEMYWKCDYCGEYNRSILYVAIHSPSPIWTEAQARAVIARRRELDISLKDLSVNVGVPVSGLADFERRHAAPMPEQHAAIMAELNLIWIAQVHYVDSSVFIGAFTSDVNAREACQQWHDARDDEPLQLAWSDSKTASNAMPMSNSVERDGVTAYVVFLTKVNQIDDSDGSSNRRHVEVR